LAVDWGILAEWVIVTLVISIVVGFTHSLYKSAERGRSHGMASFPARGAGVMQVIVSGADMMLLYGEEALKKGDLDQCVKAAYSTAEEIMTQAARNIGLSTEHTTLTDFGRRLTTAGLLNLYDSELAPLDAAIGGLGQPPDREMATRALSAAFSVRNYFMHAPIVRTNGKRPIGPASPLSSQA